MQTLKVSTSISAPIITDAMKWALLLSIAQQLGVKNEQAIEFQGGTRDALVTCNHNH